MIFVDRSLVGLLWPLLPTFETVQHVVVMDDGGRRARATPARAASCTTTRTLLAARRAGRVRTSTTRTGPRRCVTRAAPPATPRASCTPTARPCCTRWACMTRRRARRAPSPTSILPVVPMFHANAWGLAHAAVAAGADLVHARPDLSPPAIADLIETEQVTVAAGVPTIWMGVLPELEGPRHVDAAGHPVRRLGGAQGAVGGYREQTGLPILQAWGMTETSPVAIGRPHQVVRSPTAPTTSWPTCAPPSASPSPGVDFRVVEPADRRAAAVGRRESRRAAGARAVDRRDVLQRRPRRRSRSPRTAGCAPATSPPSTPRATSASSTAPRTS